MSVGHNFQGQWSQQPLQQQMQQMPAESTGTEETVDTSQGSQDGGYSSFVGELLKGAPQEHITLMEPYLKKFDAGVTRRFQDLQTQYKPYANLGWDEDTASQMAEVYRVLNEEPERLYEALRESLEIGDGEQNQNGSIGGESGQGFQGLPPEVSQQLQQQQQVLEALASIVLEGQKTQQESVEDKELDSYLGLLKQEYGEFDEDYVLSLIAGGKDGEAAVKQWQGALQQAINQASQATNGLPPAILSSAGGGAVPQGEQQNLGQIPSKDIRNLIANVMSQANAAGQ